MNWGEAWQQAVNFFTDNVWDVVYFFAVYLIGLIVIKIILAIFSHIFIRHDMERMTHRFVLSIIRVLLYLVLVLILLSVIGIQITGIVTAVSAIFLAVGLAIQGNIANFANGIVIIANRLFERGDWISVNGIEGRIVDIHFLYTVMHTMDNRRVTLPNSTIMNGVVYNMGAKSLRRVDLSFSVTGETDIDKVRDLLMAAMRHSSKVKQDREIFCNMKTIGASNVDFLCYCWCNSDDYWDAYYSILKNVYIDFQQNGITIKSI